MAQRLGASRAVRAYGWAAIAAAVRPLGAEGSVRVPIPATAPRAGANAHGKEESDDPAGYPGAPPSPGRSGEARRFRHRRGAARAGERRSDRRRGRRHGVHARTRRTFPHGRGVGDDVARAHRDSLDPQPRTTARAAARRAGAPRRGTRGARSPLRASGGPRAAPCTSSVPPGPDRRRPASGGRASR